MSIRFSKYINITSGVGGNAAVPTRQFGLRVWTTNPLLSPSAILQFATADDVGLYFGSGSDEYLRAVKYFGYISPTIAAPDPIQFARWANVDSPAGIVGDEVPKVLASLNLVVAGTLQFQFGAEKIVTVADISFAAATTLALVASELQTALRANDAPELSTSTVVFDPTTQRFNFTASNVGVATEPFAIVQSGVGVTDVAQALGWYTTTGAVMLSAQVAEQPVDAFSRSQNVNNNFGTVIFAKAAALTLPQVQAVAAANKALNVKFEYQVNVSLENAATWSAALLSTGGVALTYELAGLNEYPEQIPAAVFAATDFNALNGTVGYMYRQIAGVTPSVVDDATSDSMDALRVNYYGQTQTAGQFISFYQRGVMMGLSTDPVDMNVYANEIWLKDAIGAGLLSAQLALAKISANKIGIGQGLLVIQDDGIKPALNNGAISVGKELNVIQKLFITQQTGDANAWQQVQNIGYWYTAVITSAVAPSGITEYTLNYTLIYSKDDTVKTIVGSHQLI